MTVLILIFGLTIWLALLTIVRVILFLLHFAGTQEAFLSWSGKVKNIVIEKREEAVDIEDCVEYHPHLGLAEEQVRRNKLLMRDLTYRLGEKIYARNLITFVDQEVPYKLSRRLWGRVRVLELKEIKRV